MADVLPFRGLYYNQSLIRDITQVICPPYDIISPALQEELYHRDPYNFIRIEDARKQPQDNTEENKYTRAALTLQNWLKERVLQPEKIPAFYLDDHYFTVKEKNRMRRGIIARVRLEEWETGVVKPHENVIAGHISDRINLLRHLQVNTSPVLAMYEDKKGILPNLLMEQDKLGLMIDAVLPEGDRHVVRAVSNPVMIYQISQFFADQTLYIADGHHRYTSALTYRRERTLKSGATSEEAFNYVMMTLVDFDDPGLVILAPHRVLHNLPDSLFAGFEEKLKVYFDLMILSLNEPDVWEAVEHLQADTRYVRLACLLKGASHILVLTLRQPEKIDGDISYFQQAIYRKLDVAMVDNIILGSVLGLGSGFSDESKISYLVDRQDAASQVLNGESQAAFFVKPVSPLLIKEVSDQGAKMPRKSTYFYPKAPAGLVINTLY